MRQQFDETVNKNSKLVHLLNKKHIDLDKYQKQANEESIQR